MNLLKMTTGKELYTLLIVIFGLLLLLAAFISDQGLDAKESLLDEEIPFISEFSFGSDSNIVDDELEKFWLDK